MSSRILRAGGPHHLAPIHWPAASQGPPAETAEAEEFRRRLSEARDEGYREGEAAGRSQVRQTIEELGRALAAVAGLRSRLRREAEADLVRLSVTIARRILRREISVDPEALEGLARAALDRLQAQEIHRVRTSPEHVPALRGYLERLGTASSVEVTADPSLERGGLIFETSRGDLDASVETQLEEIERGLADRLRRRL